MMGFRIRGLQIRVHPLALLMAALAVCLGVKTEMLATLIALAVHETAHVLAALLAGVRIAEIQLMPFGGAAHMENPYGLRTGQLLFTALAGPAANFVLMVAAAALGWAGVVLPQTANRFISSNAMLMFFNLLPALPLDGGRVLYALLCERLGRKKALGLGIAMGRILAVCLGATAVVGIVTGGRINLTLILAGVFLFCAAPGEREALSNGSSYAMLNGLRPVGKPCRARVYAVDAGEDIATVLRVCKPGQPSLFCVYDHGRMKGLLDERAMVEALGNAEKSSRATVPKV